MARIVHIALKVDDLDKASKFYEEVFEFSPVGSSQSSGRTRRRLTDGTINLTLLRYDSEESAMAKAAGDGPCIHHFGIEVDDLAKHVSEAREYGCEIFGDPAVAPVKFRIPGGPMAEIVPKGRYQKAKASQSD